MTWAVLGQLRTMLGQLGTALGQLTEQAKEWQPLLAGLLVVLAAFILAAGMVRAAKIRTAAARDGREKPDAHDLRVGTVPASIDPEAFDDLSRNLETLRSLLRSALSSLSSVDTDDDVARLLCTRIAAFQGEHLSLSANADKGMRKTYATLLKQFEMLQTVLRKDWSASEASATLIQLNASARELSAILKQMESRTSDTLGRQNKN